MGVIKKAPTQLLDRAWEGQIDCSYHNENCIADSQIPFGRFVDVVATSTDPDNAHVVLVSAASTEDTIYGIAAFAGHETELGRDTETIPNGFPAYAAEDACTIEKETVMYVYTYDDLAPNDEVNVVVDGTTDPDELGRIQGPAGAFTAITLPRSMARVTRAVKAGEMARIKLDIN